MAAHATSTMLRLLNLLQALPKAGGAQVKDLESKLKQQGFEVSRRMIERDLLKLDAEGLARSDGAKPQGWARGAAGLGLQLRSLDEALALEILATYAGHLLPPSVATPLAERFAASRRTLGQHPNSDYARWRDQVAVIPLSQPLIPPTVEPAVQSTVLQALLERRVLKLRYQARYAERVREREVHPAGLVARDGQFILIAFFSRNPQPYQLPLHRMRAAEMLEANAQNPPGFDFQRYAHSGAMGMGDGQWVQLTLVFDEDAGRLFTESRLSQDQATERYELKSGAVRYRVTATVEDSRRLRAYLDSFGENLLKRSLKPVPVPAAPAGKPAR